MRYEERYRQDQWTIKKRPGPMVKARGEGNGIIVKVDAEQFLQNALLIGPQAQAQSLAF